MILAGVDIGTLTCRLLNAITNFHSHDDPYSDDERSVAKALANDQLSELHAEHRILRLGEGVDHNRILQPAAMKRVVETLQEWRGVIEEYHVDRHLAVATSAVRDASNRDEFLAMVQREAGFDVEVITGQEEARRTLLGIRSGLPPGTSDILGLDIGGGSTEFILDRDGHAPVVCSLELGVVRLTERMLKTDPPTAEELAAAGSLVAELTQSVRPMLGDVSLATFVGTAGTITTLAAIAQRMPFYDASRVHQYKLNLDTIRYLERELSVRSVAQRRGLPGLEAGREDVVVAGSLILRTIMETLELDDCLVSDMGLREGVLIDLARRTSPTSA